MWRQLLEAVRIVGHPLEIRTVCKPLVMQPVRESATSVSNCHSLCSSSSVANMKDVKTSLFPYLVPHLPWWQSCYLKISSFWLFCLPCVILKWEDVLSSCFKAVTRAKFSHVQLNLHNSIMIYSSPFLGNHPTISGMVTRGTSASNSPENEWEK